MPLLYQKLTKEKDLVKAQKLIIASQVEVAKHEFSPLLRKTLIAQRFAHAAYIMGVFADEKIIATALVEKVGQRHPYWKTCPAAEVSEAAQSNNLHELGGLAVAQNWRRQGIAKELLRLRLAFLKQQNIKFAVSTARSQSRASQTLASSHASLIEIDPQGYYRYLWKL